MKYSTNLGFLIIPLFHCLVIFNKTNHTEKFICTHYSSIFLFSKKAHLLFLNRCFMLIIYSGAQYVFLCKKNTNKDYGSNQKLIKEAKTSGTETQNWETKSLYPVTASFCKCLSRFSSPESLLSASSPAAGQKHFNQTNKAFSFCLKTRNSAKCCLRYSEMSRVHSCHRQDLQGQRESRQKVG